MPSQQPLVSVIIPHYAGTEILIQCLATLNSSSVEPEFEVILVDNASSDGSVVEAQRKFPNIRVLHLDENQGYAGGCNRGIEVARGKYVMLLNDDTEIDAACVSELAQTAEKDPTVAACQPKIRSLREPSQFEYSGAAGGLMDVYGYPFSRGRLMDDVEVDEGQYDEPVEIFWASGVCMFIRKQVLDEVGAFDETFFAYMEEIDLSWRFHLAGHRVVYVPTAVVYHIGGYSLERKNVRRMFLNHRNSMIMLFKNYSARSLLWVFPVKIVLELFIFSGALLRNPRRSQAVLLSFWWILGNVPLLLRLRESVQAVRMVPDQVIFSRLYYGMAPIWYFLFGIRQVTDLPDIEPVLQQPYRAGREFTRTGTLHPRHRNFLFAYMDQAPISLALMRAIECDLFSDLSFERPILDVGCGDGTFARILFNGVTVDAGVDYDVERLEWAKRMRCYDDLRTAKLERLPFESENFATVYGNHALEHIPDIEAALREIYRVLQPGGVFYMTVPNPRCTTYLFWPAVFERIGLSVVAGWYSKLMLRLFKAEHIFEDEEWSDLLERIGFVVERNQPYMPRKAARIQDLFLASASVSTISKALFGRRLIFPRLHRVKVRLYRRFFLPAYAERSPEGSSTLLIARKSHNGDKGAADPRGNI